MRKRTGTDDTKRPDKKRLQGIEAAAKAFEDFRPARDVLTKVRAVQTRFIQFDHATRVGGFPLERFVLAHGPSGEGKTACELGLLDSFLARDHLAFFVDAERTTPITWAREMMTHANHPGFFAARPKTYEETVENVRRFVLRVKQQRDEGVLSEDTSALVAVDSIRKLVPANILAKIVADADKHGIDGMGGRAAQMKAAMNSQWMDELIPLLEETQTTMLVIARETDDPTADKWAKLAGRDYKVGGGSALYYDASMVLRIERAAYVQEKGEDETAKAKVYGERHRITIRKSKVAGHEDKVTQAYFHTSNGTYTPLGFDRARDVIELAVKFDIVEKAGAWFSYMGERLGQGLHNAVKNLTGQPDKLDEIEMTVRDAFKRHEPVEFDEKTGEVD
jgi:recombination protein RecA